MLRESNQGFWDAGCSGGSKGQEEVSPWRKDCLKSVVRLREWLPHALEDEAVHPSSQDKIIALLIVSVPWGRCDSAQVINSRPPGVAGVPAAGDGESQRLKLRL